MAAFLDTAVDPIVLDRARAGDDDALAAIYRAFEVPVRTLARRIVVPRAAADDVAQDVFVDVITRLRQYDGRGSFAGWVRSIAVNRCLMHLRSPWQRSRRWLEGATHALDGLQDEWQRAVGSDTVDGGDAVDLERALGPARRARARRRVAARRRGLHACRDRRAVRRVGQFFEVTARTRARALAAAVARRGEGGPMQADDERSMNIAEQLRTLPPASPVADGWADVQARLTSRQRSAERHVLGMRLAAAASIALIVVTATWRVGELTRERPTALAVELTPLTADESLAVDRIAQLRTQSTALEEMLVAIGDRPVVERAGMTIPIDTLESQVQWIDHQISTRDGAARPASVEQLWRRRVAAMNSLVQLRYVEAQHVDM